MNKIFDIIDTYYKTATLLGDVAHRAMYSLIPGGKFDITAARWAASGAVDVIYYGSRTIKKELEYYKGSDNKKKKVINIPLYDVDVNGTSNYITFLREAKRLFDEDDNWRVQYGGKAWADISAALLNVAENYEALLSVKRGGEEEEGILRKIIVALNIFDGICHNTGSIYGKMTTLEAQENNETIDDAYEASEKIERIRDLTEIKNRKHLYEEIKNLVSPMRVYKDYETQIRNDPDFYKSEDISDELADIRNRKWKIMSAKTDIERLRTIRSRMAEIIKGFNVVKNICYTRNKYLAVPHIKDYIQQLENDLFNIKILLDEVRSFVVGVIIFDFCKDDNEAAKQRNAFIDEYNSVNDIFLEIDETLYKIYQKNFDENSYKVIIDICDGIIKSCKIIEEYGLKVREQLISMLNSI